MQTPKWLKKQCLPLLVITFLAAFLSACGTGAGKDISEAEKEILKKAYRIESSQETAVERPAQVVHGQNMTWVLTTTKGDCLYGVSNNTGEAESIDWQEDEDEYITAIYERNGTLYLCVCTKNEIQVRRRGADRKWSVLAAFREQDADWQWQDAGFLVDREENVYFAYGSEVVVLDRQGKACRQELKGTILFLQEYGAGRIECLTDAGGRVRRYELEEGRFEEKWTAEIACSRAIGIKNSTDAQLGILAGDNLFWIDRESGEQLAAASLTERGIPVEWILEACRVIIGDGLILYGRSGGYNLVCYTLTEQPDSSQASRSPITYGTVYLDSRMQEQIAAFNRENADYYIEVKTYDSENAGMRLQADLAGGKGPDIIDMYTFGGRYQDFVE